MMIGLTFGQQNNNNENSNLSFGQTNLFIKDYKYDDLQQNLKIIDYFGEGAKADDNRWVEHLLTEYEANLARKIYQDYEQELSKILNQTSTHSLHSLTESFRRDENQISGLAYKIDKFITLYKKNNNVFSWNRV